MRFISHSSVEGWIDVSIPPEMSEEFKVLVTRATNTWQDMSPEMRDFADRVLGKDKIVGQNMKAGHSDNIRSIDWESMPKFVAGIEEFKALFLNAPAIKFCEGHPETCNCPQHCPD